MDPPPVGGTYAGLVRNPASSSMGAAQAIMADSNPWQWATTENATTGPYQLKDADYTVGVGWSKAKTKLANSKNHRQEGQNVMFGDTHVIKSDLPLLQLVAFDLEMANLNIFPKLNLLQPQVNPFF
jgi:hypothetical protein